MAGRDWRGTRNAGRHGWLPTPPTPTVRVRARRGAQKERGRVVVLVVGRVLLVVSTARAAGVQHGACCIRCSSAMAPRCAGGWKPENSDGEREREREGDGSSHSRLVTPSREERRFD
jgi:hypothetical protein